jgi:hypothetical protein
MNRDTEKHIAEQGLESIGRFYGLYRGFVVDNNDPEKRGRLIIRMPELQHEQIFDDWIYGRAIYNTSQGGIFAIPEINSPVFVSFLNGDKSHPIWEFGWFPDKEIPQDFKDNYLKGITFRQEKILISQTEGYKVELGNNGIEVSKDDVKILLTDTKITFQQNSTMVILDNGVSIKIGGLSLKNIFTDLLTALKSLKVMIGAAPSGPPTPDTIALFTVIESKVNALLK